mmetsp:Transcript_51519/g.164770  ORF Transcript_51519/g.164770 Transcript_51519/m.164770 type:complete len:261 (+) Transcript_51519:936-1718(+)
MRTRPYTHCPTMMRPRTLIPRLTTGPSAPSATTAPWKSASSPSRRVSRPPVALTKVTWDTSVPRIPFPCPDPWLPVDTAPTTLMWGCEGTLEKAFSEFRAVFMTLLNVAPPLATTLPPSKVMPVSFFREMSVSRVWATSLHDWRVPTTRTLQDLRTSSWTRSVDSGKNTLLAEYSKLPPQSVEGASPHPRSPGSPTPGTMEEAAAAISSSSSHAQLPGFSSAWVATQAMMRSSAPAAPTLHGDCLAFDEADDNNMRKGLR